MAHATAPPHAIDDWDRHWDDYSEAAARNPAQQYRRRLAMSLLAARDAPVRLVDIGSGQGDFLADAARRWPSAGLLGLEVSEHGVEQARAKVPQADFLVCDLLRDEPPPERRSWATHAVCSEVLEHVDDPGVLLRNAAAYLAPGCRLVVTVPGGPMSAFDRHIGHRRHFTPTTLQTLLATSGFDVESVTGAGFPFFNMYRRLVIARGDRLVDDVAPGETGQPGLSARAVMAAFRPIFRLNLPRTAWGWQIVGVGTLARG
jgi:SAM-dependent methyltransferase